MCRTCPTNIGEVFKSHKYLGVDLGDIGEVRKLLGPDAASFPDAEVAHIRDLVLALADTAFAWWLHRRNARLAELADGADTGVAGSPASPEP